MRLFDILKHNAPGEYREWWDNCQFVVADSIQSMVDREKDFAYFRQGSDFVLYPPFTDFVVEGLSEVTGGIQLGAIEVLDPDTAANFMAYFGAKNTVPDGAKWVYFITCHMAHKNRRIPVSTFHQANCYVSEDGALLNPANVAGEIELIMRPEHVRALEPYRSLGDEVISQLLTASIKDTLNIASLIMFVITIMNCKNVELVEEIPQLGRRARRAIEIHGKPPQNVYKTLQIKRTKKQLEKLEKETGLSGRKLRAHFRRGYPLTFSEDAPAFGKSWGVGTFFVSPMIKGNIDKGEVYKTYEILGD